MSSCICSGPRSAGSTTSRRCGGRSSAKPAARRAEPREARALMRLLIVAVGRVKAGPLADLQTEYLNGVTWPIAGKELEGRRALPAAGRRAGEGELLLAALPEDAVVVALDERG